MLYAIALSAFVADQVTKIVAVAALRPGETTPVLDGVLHWTLQRNPGAAFSLFTRVPWLFTILAFVISIVIVRISLGVTSRLYAAALGSVLGGAVGNLADRVFRDPGVFTGHVVDFIDFRVWPVFNLADVAVVTGAVLLVVVSYRNEKRGPSPSE